MRQQDNWLDELEDLDFPDLELPETDWEETDLSENGWVLPEELDADLADEFEDEPTDETEDWEAFEPIHLPDGLDVPPVQTTAEEGAVPEPVQEETNGVREKFRRWKASKGAKKPPVERVTELTGRLRQIQEDICDNIEEQHQETKEMPEEQEVLREKFDRLKRDFTIEAGLNLVEKAPEPPTMVEKRPSQMTEEEIDAFYAAALEKQRRENVREARETVDQMGVPLDGGWMDFLEEKPLRTEPIDQPAELEEETEPEPEMTEAVEPEVSEAPLEPEESEEAEPEPAESAEAEPEPEAPVEPAATEVPAVEEQTPPPKKPEIPQLVQKKKTAVRKKAFAAKRKQVLKRMRQVQYCSFFGVLLLFGIIGLAFFARPTTSQLENRELTAFPKFTVASFLNGSYTSEISTWYSDTYPLRESLIAGANRLKSLYGLRGTQLIGGSSGGDEIPDSYDSSAETETPTASETLAEEDEELEDLEDGTIFDDLAQVGDIYIAGNKGFGVYYFVQSNSDRFVELMNKQYEEIKDEANLYVLVAPISAGVMLDQSVLDTIGASDEQAAIDYLYSGMDENIHTLSVFETLKAHNAEYIYFNTDHHWTSLGAYYAYKEFCEEKGWTAHSLDDFETMEFDNFLGTFYTKSNASATLAANADTVTAYIPNGTNDMVITTQAGEEYDWKIITDVSSWKNNSYYSCFVGGDEQFGEIHNPDITDGSSIVVVKDSYADAFIPFLVDHYQDIYICDIRYYPGTIQDLVEEKEIDDVLYLLAIGNTSASSGVTNIAARVGE